MIAERLARTRLRYRVAGGFAVLLVLFLVLIVGHFVITERQHARDRAGLRHVAGLRETNQSVLQHLTDAETGVRGFQLTGDTAFLEPWTSGRAGAFAELDALLARATEPEVRRLIGVQRQAAEQWLYGYAIPIVNAGAADADPVRAARGKELFDRIRTANADVSAAVEDQGRRIAATELEAAGRATLIFAALAVLIVLTGLGQAMLHQRHLLVPLEHIRLTLRRLADGDLSARAVPAGPGELRAVMTTLNDLAAETERLITAERARAARGQLRQAVAAELRADDDPRETARRIAGLVGAALGAEAVHGVLTALPGETITVRWPDGADELDAAVARAVRSAAPGPALSPAGLPGVLAVPLGGDAGCPPGMIAVVRRAGPGWTADERQLLAALGRDIDHTVRQWRLRLRQTKLIDELRRLDERKDAFVATVTHELRTPLTSILGYTEILTEDDGHLSPAQRRALLAVSRNAHRLEETVGSLTLLDRTGERTDTGTGPVDLGELVSVLGTSLRPAADARALDWTVAPAAVVVRGDAGQLERAVRHLLDNAIKFTGPGGRVECRVDVDGDRVALTVSDTGIGIPADDLPALFTPFHRAANAIEHAVQGSGLGLAIVRNIVNDHGGTVTVRSEPGRGSTFTVTLPVLDPAYARPGPEPSRSGPGSAAAR